MKKTLILILLLILIAGCTKVKLNSDIKETVQGVPDHNNTPKIDIVSKAIEKITDLTTNKVNQTETNVESFGDVV